MVSQSSYEEILDAISDGVYFVDLDRVITRWNKAAERISGYSAQEVIGKRCADGLLRHVDECGNDLCLNGCPLAATIEDNLPREAQLFMHHKLGYRVPVFVRSCPIHDERGGGLIGVAEIFFERKNKKDILNELEILRKEVFHDPLTGAGNRRVANITFEQMHARLIDSSVPYGVIFVDIDFFKDVNDKWGHLIGDLLLQMVAKTLGSGLRPMDILCRWGGEEFIVLVPNTNHEALGIIAERLRVLVEKSWITHEGEEIRLTVSFGGAVSKVGEPPESVIDRADKQLYISKNSGRNCVHIDEA